MDVGWRVADKASNKQGLVAAVLFQNAKNYDSKGSWDGTYLEEDLVRWDDGTQTWEPRDFITRVPNVTGDISRHDRNGMGLVEGLTSPEQPDLHRKNDAQVYTLRCMGLLPQPRVRRSDKRPARKQPDERAVELSRHAATGEPMLVRKGMLKHSCYIKSPPTRLGWAARALKLGPKARIKRHSKW